MAKKNTVRVDRFTSKAGDFQVVKPAPKTTKTTTKNTDKKK